MLQILGYIEIYITCYSNRKQIYLRFGLAPVRPDAWACPACCACFTTCASRCAYPPTLPAMPPAPARPPRSCRCAYPTFTRLSTELELPWWDWGKGRQGRERRGEGKAHHTRKARGRRPSPAAGCCPWAIGTIVACATPDLLLKHLDETFATYV
jgi:hypothetical protein